MPRNGLQMSRRRSRQAFAPVARKSSPLGRPSNTATSWPGLQPRGGQQAGRHHACPYLFQASARAPDTCALVTGTKQGEEHRAAGRGAPKKPVVKLPHVQAQVQTSRVGRAGCGRSLGIPPSLAGELAALSTGALPPPPHAHTRQCTSTAALVATLTHAIAPTCKSGWPQP